MELAIRETTDESDSEFVLADFELDAQIYLDYATRVANGDRPEKIALYKQGIPVGTIPVSAIDEPLTRVNELLLEEADPITENEV